MQPRVQGADRGTPGGWNASTSTRTRAAAAAAAAATAAAAARDNQPCSTDTSREAATAVPMPQAVRSPRDRRDSPSPMRCGATTGRDSPRLRPGSRDGSRRGSPARERPAWGQSIPRTMSGGGGGSQQLGGGSPSQRSRSWTPPMGGSNSRQIGIDARNSEVGDSALPLGWRTLLNEAYREFTGRPMVDRIRLLEVSSAPGRPTDGQVFWLHTMVRWCDMRLVGSERCPERGEDLALFVLNCCRGPAGHEELSVEEKIYRRRRGKQDMICKVTSVRVLNSVYNMDEEGSAEQGEFVGRLGAILLYDALGPLLADSPDVSFVDVVEVSLADNGSADNGLGETCPPSPPAAGSPLPPPPPIVSPMLLQLTSAASGSLSVPAPFRQPAPTPPGTVMTPAAPGPMLSGSGSYVVAGGPMTPRTLCPAALGPPLMGTQVAVVSPRQTPRVSVPQLLVSGLASPPTVVGLPCSSRGSRSGRGITGSESF